MRSSTHSMADQNVPESGGTRSHQFELELNATQEQVWAALTEADEIIKWFAPEARVEPGVGGKIFLSWGPGMEGASEITVWKPGEHLQTIMPAGTPEAPRTQVVEYFLETRGGNTVLRLVHSGFGTDSKWDGEYESTHSGWLTFLAMLRYALEERPGAKAVTHYQNLFLKVDRDEIYRRVTGPDGLALQAASMTEGSAFSAQFGGVPIHGKFPRAIEGKCFILAAEELDGALLAFFCEAYQGQGMLTVQAVVYGENAEVRAKVESGLAGFCEKLFPEGDRVSFG